MERLVQEEIRGQLKDDSVINASKHRKLVLSEKNPNPWYFPTSL